METITEPQSASPRQLWSLTWAHSTAVFRHRPAYLRWLMAPFAVVIAPSITGWIERRELYLTGHTTVAMRRTVNRRPATLTATTCTLICLIGFPVAFAATYVQVFTYGTSPIGAALALIMLLVIVAALAARTPRPKTVVDEEHAAIRELSVERPVVVLHDLARPGTDRPGTGTELVAGIIRHPDFTGTTIVATAATDQLAALYVQAGMTRFTPTSRTVYYRA